MTIEPEEIHQNYYGMAEEDGDRFNEQWVSKAKEVHLDKLQAQAQNGKKMLSHLPDYYQRNVPQIANGSHSNVKPAETIRIVGQPSQNFSNVHQSYAYRQ